MARNLRNNANEIETLLWSRLRRSQIGGFKFSRQMPVAGFFPDFVCRGIKLIVELDGSQHADAIAYDRRRTDHLRDAGFTVIRFWNSDVLTNMDGVLETILAKCEHMASGQQPDPSTSPPARGRGPRGGYPARDGVTSRERQPTPQPPPASGRGST